MKLKQETLFWLREDGTLTIKKWVYVPEDKDLKEIFLKRSTWIMVSSVSEEHKNVQRFKGILLVVRDEEGDSQICG